MPRRPGLSTLTATVCAIATSIAVGCAAPARTLHLDVTLQDGERLPGGGYDRAISLFTEDRGRREIPLSSVRAIDGNGDGETVTVRLVDGLLWRGVLETPTLEVVPPGDTAERRVDTGEMRALRVTPRIAIAGSGDAWWDLAFENALGFEVANVDGRLTVVGIDPAHVNHGSHGKWSTVTLGRDVRMPRDFTLDARISWDASGAGPRAMQNLYVTLLDDEGAEIVCAGHHDAWDATTGSRYSRIDGVPRESGYGTQPAAGCADLRVVRSDGRIRVLWDGNEERVGGSTARVARIVIQTDFYAYQGPSSRSVFGRAALERLTIR